MAKRLPKLLKHMVILLAGSALAGTLLLTLVFCIPTETIRRHVASSVDKVLCSEKEHPDNAFLGYVRTNKESFTDSIMVQYAFEKIPGKNAFEHAMWAYHHDLNLNKDEPWRAEDSLRALAKEADADISRMDLKEYSRYWHGYLIYLKPLLLLFSWSQVVWLGVVLQLALMALVVVMSWKKRCPGTALVMAAGLLFLKPALVLVSLTMSVCWLITLAALLFMLFRREWLEENKYYPEFFLCIGISVAYFDFLTYPVVTLGVPLCVCFLMVGRERLVSGLSRLVGYSVCWGIGYAGMWASKWIIADLTLRTGTIKDAVWNVLGRTEAIGGRGIAARANGGMHVIALNLQQYDVGFYPVIYPVMALVLALAVMALLVLVIVKRPEGESNKSVFLRLTETVIPYVVVSLIPFVWIVAVQHHSALHARFTFRIISVAASAFAAAGVALWREMAGSNLLKCKKI